MSVDPNPDLLHNPILIDFPTSYILFKEVPGVKSFSEITEGLTGIKPYSGLEEFIHEFQERFPIWKKEQGEVYSQNWNDLIEEQRRLTQAAQEDTLSDQLMLFPSSVCPTIRQELQRESSGSLWGKSKIYSWSRKISS